MSQDEKEIQDQNAELNLEQDQDNNNQEDNASDNKSQSDAEKFAEMQDKFLRLYSEFENFRRRTNKEKQELIQFGNKDLILNILPVYDDFERAMPMMEKAENKEAIIDGVKLIYTKFKGILQSAGLKPIEAVGQDFDPELFDAITIIPAPTPALKGKVVDQVQTGYFLNDKIIRHSKVVVGE